MRALRPYESDVVGEVRAVKRIVEKKSRRDTNMCVSNRAGPFVDLEVWVRRVPMRQVVPL